MQLLSFLCLLSAVSAQLYPGFSSFRADQQNSGVSTFNGTTTGRELWDFDTYVYTGDMIDSTAAIGKNGDLFFTISNFLFCVSKSGERKWHYRAEGIFFQSTAAVTDDSLYIIGSNFDWGSATNRAIIYALSTSGELLWKYVTNYPRMSGSVNMMADGTIIAVLGGYHVHAFSPKGDIIWEYDEHDTFDPNTFLDEMTPSILVDGSIVYGSKDGFLRSLSPDGTLKWKIAFTPFDTFTSPTVGADGNIYVTVGQGSAGASVYSVTPEGALDWKFAAPGAEIGTSPTYHNGNVYVIVDSFLYSLHRGEVMWVFHFHDSIVGDYAMWNAPIIAKNDILYVGGWWWMYGFDVSNTGKDAARKPVMMFQSHTYATSTTGNGPAPSIDADGNLYFGVYSKLYAVGRE